ncbi:IS3 family transposase [Reinekea forsetii]
MESCSNTGRKRTQRDYTLAFKLSVVDQVEKGELTYKQAQKRYGIQGRSTVLVWLRKHGTLDWTSQRVKPLMNKETPEQKIKRLEKALEDKEDYIYLMDETIKRVDQIKGTSFPKKVLRVVAREAQARGRMTLARSCRLIGISRQAMYQELARKRQKSTALSPVLDWVYTIRRDLPRLGGRKLYHLLQPELQRQQIKLGRDGLFTLLRQHRLLIMPARQYRKTTHSKHWMRKYPNLYQGMAIDRPEQAYVSDITYLESREGVHYLSLVTDAYSRKIVGHHVSDDLSAKSVVKALDQMLIERQSRERAIHHSDRGLQYCSELYQSRLASQGITPSMTTGYDCYQNALAERINGILKNEFLIHQYKDKEELEQVVKESIDAYNHKRPHSSLGMLTPASVHEKAN